MAAKNGDVVQYNRIIATADEYYKKALWQERLRCLQEALLMCERPDFPAAEVRKTQLLYDLGSLWRKLGQYDKAEETIRAAFTAFATADVLIRADLLNELGVVLRLRNRFSEAVKAISESYDLALNAVPSLEAELQLCRAIGNIGMCTYNMSRQTQPVNLNLLQRAIEQLKERTRRAQSLQQGSLANDPNSTEMGWAKMWEIVGLDRLSLCYIAAGDIKEALRVTEESQRKQTRFDPTLAAYSKFFYGNSLWAAGHNLEAVAQWNAPNGSCSSPMAFCKEPAAEHTEYIKLMADAGVNFDTNDEQGYSALDYAVLSDNPDAKRAIPIVVAAVRERLRRELVKAGGFDGEIDRRLDEETSIRLHQADLRRRYRILLQEHIRPLLRHKESFSFQKLRREYSRFLFADTKELQIFSTFQYVKYVDFKAHGKLPVSSAGLTNISTNDFRQSDDFVVFISYRWLDVETPDNASGSQWRRIIDALEKLLAANPDLGADRLSLWLVSSSFAVSYCPRSDCWRIMHVSTKRMSEKEHVA